MKKIKKLFALTVLRAWKSYTAWLFLLFCGTIVPTNLRSTEYIKNLFTRRTEQLQERNAHDIAPVHAGLAEPDERKHGAADRKNSDANNKRRGVLL